MSGVQAVGQSGGAPDVRVSIARAAEATGIDFNYLLAQAKLESSLNSQARAGTSSAAGLYQFLGSTWLDTLDKHGDEYGLSWASQAIDDSGSGRKTVDPAMRSEIMALRYDPDAASLMAAELAKDNRTALTTTLGREPDFAELYMAHFLGADGASRFLTALQQSPGASAAALFPQAAAANRPVFYGAGGAPRSLGEVMNHFRQRMDQAAATAGDYPAGTYPPQFQAAAASVQDTRPLGPLAREFHAAAGGQSPQSRPSMVDTLRETFGAGGRSASLPANVQAAYTKLKAFDL